MIEKNIAQVSKLMLTCAEIESVIARIYRILACLHAKEPPAERLWLKTAAEEDNHQSQFELGYRLCPAIVSGMVVDNESADGLLRKLLGAVVEIETSRPDIAAALEFAIDMEIKLSKFHMDGAIIFTDDSHRSMFWAMMAADDAHVQTLKDFQFEYHKRYRAHTGD